jgi:hypothetical protein
MMVMAGAPRAACWNLRYDGDEGGRPKAAPSNAECCLAVSHPTAAIFAVTVTKTLCLR